MIKYSHVTFNLTCMRQLKECRLTCSLIYKKLQMPDHSEYECKIFAESPVSPVVTPSEYEKIKTLRLLLLKEKYPEKWKLILDLESRESMRRQNFYAVTSDIALYKFIKQECHLTQFDFEEVHHAAGVSAVHSYHADPQDGNEASNQNTRWVV